MCTVIYAPPDVERTLTVGREAILEDSLEDSLDGADGLDDCVDWKNKVYQFYSLPTNRAKQARPRASNALDGRLGGRVYNAQPATDGLHHGCTYSLLRLHAQFHTNPTFYVTAALARQHYLSSAQLVRDKIKRSTLAGFKLNLSPSCIL